MNDSVKDIPARPRIMVVDDHKGTVQMISHILKRTYAVSGTTSAKHALNQMQAEPCDILITDLKMDEMDGITLLRKTRTIYPGLLAIVITGHADKDVAVDSIREGVYDFIEKPVEPRDLLRSIAGGWKTYSLNEELKRTNAALKVSRSSFRSIVTKSAEAIIVTDLNGIVRFANPMSEQTFDRRANQLLGSPFGFALISEQSTQVDIIRPDRKQGVGEMRVVKTNWDGEEAYLVSIRDITHRSRMEIKLKQRRIALEKMVKDLKQANRKVMEQQKSLIKEARLKALLQLAGATAHELNQPLMAMLGNIQLLKMKKAELESGEQHLDKIEAAGNRMADIVRRIQTIYHDDTCAYAGASSIIDLHRTMIKIPTEMDKK